MKDILQFRGQYRWLSNFANMGFSRRDTIEHYYQAAKATNHKDMVMILLADTPQEAKRKGRTIKLREDWEDVKIPLILNLLRSKFKAGKFRRALLKTEDAYLCEGNNWHDHFFGYCCICKDGLNVLGELIMLVRRELQEEK